MLPRRPSSPKGSIGRRRRPTTAAACCPPSRSTKCARSSRIVCEPSHNSPSGGKHLNVTLVIFKRDVRALLPRDPVSTHGPGEVITPGLGRLAFQASHDGQLKPARNSK